MRENDMKNNIKEKKLMRQKERALFFESVFKRIYLMNVKGINITLNVLNKNLIRYLEKKLKR